MTGVGLCAGGSERGDLDGDGGAGEVVEGRGWTARLRMTGSLAC